jgi:demethylmenaquinone methyltransferase/2-methoxy-6-polyprenyl-1,4-benzoquinol methylase
MRFVMPVVASVASSNRDAYGYLRESIEQWPDQGTLSQWIRGVGFTRVAYRNLTAGVVALHRGHKPEDPGIRASTAKRRKRTAS